MNALNLMKALRDVPEDLIDECFDTPPVKRITPEKQPDIFTECQPEQPAKPIVRHKEKHDLPRLFSGITVAACLVFAVGFGIVMLHGSKNSPPVQHQPEDSEAQPVTEVTEPEAVQTDSSAAYAELELHDPEAEKNRKENCELLLAEGQKRFEENGCKPAVIDTGKYISKYFSAAPQSENSLNSIEAKSYLYHMMLNSIDYFRTAKGTMTYAIPESGVYQVDFQYDRENQCAYERHSQPWLEVHDTEDYYTDNTDYIADPEAKTYTSVRTVQEPDFILSDNDRVIFRGVNNFWWFSRPSQTCRNIFGSSLFPQQYAMNNLWAFDAWEITGTAELLGRTCGVISGQQKNKDSFVMYTDVETGILLRYETFSENGETTGFVRITDLTVDEDITVKQFDPTGYTCTGESGAVTEYQVNEYGQTYGSALDTTRIEDFPDLMACIGDNGKKGYIYSGEYLEIQPKSPEEAEKISEAQHNGTFIPRVLTVYESDGRTAIDTLTEKP